VNAGALANNKVLTLAGSATEVVSGLIGNIAAGSLTGALTVTTGDATDNTISITTGSAATSITASGVGDTITVKCCGPLADNIALTLTGSAAEVVTGLIGDTRGRLADRRIDGDDGERHRRYDLDHDRLGGDFDHRQRGRRHHRAGCDSASQQYRADADRVGGGGGDWADRQHRGGLADRRIDGDDGGNATDDTISITTGSAATSITASGAGDTISVNAAALANNHRADADRLGRRRW